MQRGIKDGGSYVNQADNSSKEHSDSPVGSDEVKFRSDSVRDNGLHERFFLKTTLKELNTWEFGADRQC